MAVFQRRRNFVNVRLRAQNDVGAGIYTVRVEYRYNLNTLTHAAEDGRRSVAINGSRGRNMLSTGQDCRKSRELKRDEEFEI